MSETTVPQGSKLEELFTPEDITNIRAALEAVAAGIGGLSLGQTETETPLRSESRLAASGSVTYHCG